MKPTLRILPFTLAIALASTAHIAAQAPTPDAALKELQSLVGSWTFELNVKASAFGPAAKITGIEHFQWLPGAFFLRMERQATGPAGPFTNLALIGYDAVLRRYSQAVFNLTTGWSGTFTGPADANALTWSGIVDVGGKPLHMRCSWTLTAQASRTTRCEASADRKVWLITEEGTHTRQTP